MGRYDSSEYVLLKGLNFLPENVELRKRLAYFTKNKAKKDLQMNELDRLSLTAKILILRLNCQNFMEMKEDMMIKLSFKGSTEDST